MFNIIKNKIVLLIIDVIVILLCFAGYYLISIKADLPFSTSTSGSYHVIYEVSETEAIFSVGDTITTIEGYSFNGWEEAEVYLDGKNVDDIISVELVKNGLQEQFYVKLVNYYSFFDLIMIVIVGFVFISMAIFVRRRAPDNISATLFHLVSLGLGIVIIINAGNYFALPYGYGYLSRIIWLFAYNLIPVLFIRLTTSLTGKPIPGSKKLISLLYLVAVINAIILSYLFLISTAGGNTDQIKNYVWYYDSIFRIFLIICIIIAITICIRAYRLSKTLQERKKIKWLLLGFFIGPFGFIIFWILPIILLGHELIPEAFVLLFLVAVPVTFGIAIVRYQFMDIDLIVRRSVVYSIILAIIILVYIGLTSVITLFIKDVNPALPSVITALLVAILLQPIKSNIQKFVDKKFFRLEYDYRKEQMKFLADIKDSNDVQSLAEKIVTLTDGLIPVYKIAFFILRKSDNRILILAQKGFDIIKNRSIKLEVEKLKTDLSLPIALDDKVERDVGAESADISVFKRWGMAIAFPVKSPSGQVHGFIVLGKKKSDARYFKEDIDLLNSVSSTAALTIDRIQLQEELIREQLESERLEELNKLKSYFVSSVSHELKTPLTSIKMFSELLQNKNNISKEKSNEYLHIIEGESERLRRLIDNVLNSAKIEEGLKTYELISVSLNDLVERAVRSVEYQFKIAKILLKKEICKEKIIINADPDAVEEAVLNLLSNAIKYSPAKTETIITTSVQKGYAVVDVKDKGAGIADEDVENIFDPFFRTKDTKLVKAEGTGLGLAIVKHIMDAHMGRINVQSEVGKGSTFSLFFPLRVV
jgi:signal transduction histidine kinase